MGYIFAGTTTKDLAEKVVQEINEHRTDDDVAGKLSETSLGKCSIERFANGEISCQFEESVRDKTIYIFGHTGTNEIMELLLMIDAARRAHAQKIIAVVPCYGYARQDKREGIRGPLGGRLVADMLSVSGINSILTIDLHSDAIEGFFSVPPNHVSGLAIFKNSIRSLIGANKDDYIIASPDAGGANRARAFARKFDMQVVVMNKARSKPGEIASIDLVGDVTGKKIIIVDDMVDSAGTLCSAADYLIKSKGAKEVMAICTHPFLTVSKKGEEAVDRIEKSLISQLWISDTLPIKQAALVSPKIKVISSAEILAKIISRVYTGSSMNAVNS